jgi:hypothetical protein
MTFGIDVYSPAVSASERRIAELLAILDAVPVGLALREVQVVLDILIEAGTMPDRLRAPLRETVEPVLARRFPGEA